MVQGLRLAEDRVDVDGLSVSDGGECGAGDGDGLVGVLCGDDLG